ncbi:hypothetical protein FACS189450_09210 [Spirochaetia bacterium]|nr:hypothetical protein FACS189450_09210 [Spirochaetia bacterium]
MPLSWNEIRSRASAFILEWKDSETTSGRPVREKAAVYCVIIGFGLSDRNTKREATLKYAEFPSLFSEIRQPSLSYILFPQHSSE